MMNHMERTDLEIDLAIRRASRALAERYGKQVTVRVKAEKSPLSLIKEGGRPEQAVRMGAAKSAVTNACEG